jgi:hypothetical protein
VTVGKHLLSTLAECPQEIKLESGPVVSNERIVAGWRPEYLDVLEVGEGGQIPHHKVISDFFSSADD